MYDSEPEATSDCGTETPQRAYAAIELEESRSLLKETERRLKKANDEVARLTELKALLEQHPETQRILELLHRKY